MRINNYIVWRGAGVIAIGKFRRDDMSVEENIETLLLVNYGKKTCINTSRELYRTLE